MGEPSRYDAPRKRFHENNRAGYVEFMRSARRRIPGRVLPRYATESLSTDSQTLLAQLKQDSILSLENLYDGIIRITGGNTAATSAADRLAVVVHRVTTGVASFSVFHYTFESRKSLSVAHGKHRRHAWKFQLPCSVLAA